MQRRWLRRIITLTDRGTRGENMPRHPSPRSGIIAHAAACFVPGSDLVPVELKVASALPSESRAAAEAQPSPTAVHPPDELRAKQTVTQDRANQAHSYLTGSDDSFDALYPAAIQRVSRRYWTPVGIARRAAELLRDAGARHVLDVGSGVGKFVLVAAATAPELRWAGIEQRAHLVAHARAAKHILAITNAHFLVGDATDAMWEAYDGFYFFNSFAENLFDEDERLDDRAELSLPRFARDVTRAEAALRAAAVGTAIATYHGSSGRVPCSFELAHVGRMGSGWLRLWIKRYPTDDGSFFVEVDGSVEGHDAGGRRSTVDEI